MPLMILDRPHTVRSLQGHTLGFEVGKAISVPDVCVAEALAVGAVIVAGEDTPTAAVDPDITVTDTGSPLSPVERKAKIFAVFKDIQLRNRRGDFSVDNRPHPREVSKLCGFTVMAQERDILWGEYNAGE